MPSVIGSIDVGRWLLLGVLPVAALSLPGAVRSQPADLPLVAADGSELPNDIRVGRVDGVAVYTDRAGRVLYGLDMRTVLRWAPDPAQYCTQECRKTWRPVLAPKGRQPNIRFPEDNRPRVEPGFVNPLRAPDWTIIAGTDGPQWVYKGWHLVYVRSGKDGRSTVHDGADRLTWNTLKYVPPPPQLIAPPGVTARFLGGAYRLTDAEGHLLFTGDCAAPCAWRPFTAPLASAGLGEWQVQPTPDAAQWAHQGRLVFAADSGDLALLPAGARALQP